MLSSNLIRWSGLAAILAGGLWIVGGILLGLRPPGMPGGPHRESGDVSLLLSASLVLIAVGLVGLHFRQAERAGRWGKTAFTLAVIGAVALFVGLMVNLTGLIDAWIITVTPGFLALVVGLLFSGVATLGATVLPRWAGVLFIVASLALLFFNTEDARAWLAVLFGVAWVALGYAVWSGMGQSAAQPTL
jgi:hypothetical protein